MGHQFVVRLLAPHVPSPPWPPSCRPEPELVADLVRRLGAHLQAIDAAMPRRNPQAAQGK